METIELYGDSHWISPYVFSVFVALEEKGVPYELVDVSLPDRQQHAERYRSLSLTGRVPSLRHGDFSLSESQAIVEYLDEVFPAPKYAPLLPADRQQRARARQLMAWIRSDLMPIREERATWSIFYRPTGKPLSEAGEQAAQRLTQAVSRLLSHGRSTLFDQFSIADADIALMLGRLIKNGDTVPSDLVRYFETVWSRPSVHKFVSRPRPEYREY